MLEGVFPYVAMMQVAAEDTEDDYVICRGFDIRMDRFIDYAAGDADKPGIPVAKPYGRRQSGLYRIGQVFPAILPFQTGSPSPSSVPWRVGQNPGVAADSVGHPADLNETINALEDSGFTKIAWQLLDDPDGPQRFCLAVDHPGRGVVFTVYRGTWDPDTHAWTFDTSVAIEAIDWFNGAPEPNSGARCWGVERPSNTYGVIVEVLELDCDSPGACS